MHTATDIAYEIPDTTVGRMRGLLFRDGLPRGRVMVFKNCRLIHTAGMRFALDVFFVDKKGGVVKIVRGVKPGRIVFGGFRARHTVEAEAGWLPEDAVFDPKIFQ